MPTISMFYGLIIRMYFAPQEHPPPHFHVYYNEYRAIVDIRTCEIYEEKLPSKQTKLVLAWAERNCFMYQAIIKVTPNKDFILSLVFENGESGQLDIKPILDFGIFTRLRNYNNFKQVRVSFDTIEWNCGVDLDPEYIYKKCVKQKPSITKQSIL